MSDRNFYSKAGSLDPAFLLQKAIPPADHPAERRMIDSFNRMREVLSNVKPWFIAGTVAILLVPILRVLADYQTFIHPWRPELAAAVLLAVFLAVGLRDTDFPKTLAAIPAKELQLIVLPCIAFILWSAMSALWARSTASVLHHTTVWVSYLAFYCLFRYSTRDSKSVQMWMVGMMTFLWIICLPPLIEYYVSALSGNHTSITLRFSKYTETANAILPLVAAYALQSKGRAAYLGYATVILVCLFTAATMSRTGIGIFIFICTALVISIFAFPALRSYRIKVVTLAVALIAVTVCSSLTLMAAVGKIPAVERAVSPASAVSSKMRVLFLDVAFEMWRDKPILGVGADNYGLTFSPYREKYAQRAPNDQVLRLADDQLAERAHNEYVQILAELGIVGIGIFGAFLFGIGYSAHSAWRSRTNISLNAVAGLVSVIAFLASSLVTSYSFRVYQNGLVFFFALAVAVGGTYGPVARKHMGMSKLRLSVARFAMLLALAACICLGAYSAIRIAALHEMLMGARTESPELRDAHYGRALALDPENALIYRAVWTAALSDGDPRKASEYLRKSIDRGQATTSDYSYLATSQILNGDLPAASAVIEEALRQYPMSTFLRVRYGVILQMNGQTAEADRQFALANNLDPAQSATWRVYIESGAARASQFAFATQGVEVMDLLPKSAIYAIKKERDIRFPEERTDIPW